MRKKALATVLQLVLPAPDMDTIETLENLLELAQQGELIGIAFVAMCKERQFLLNVVGETLNQPTFTRGMLAALNDKLARLISR